MGRPQKSHQLPGAQSLTTKQALLHAALTLMERDRSFDSLSLREVAREVGVVPTTFYRHFPDMTALGLELVDQSFVTLSKLARSASATQLSFGRLVRQSVETFVAYVRDHPRHFRFLARERFGGIAEIRQAITERTREIVEQTADDLAELPQLAGWQRDDVLMLADFLVGILINTAEQILQADADVERITERAISQFRLVLLGVPHWRRKEKP